MARRKAYHVQYGDQRYDFDTSACVVFAESSGKARNLGAKELDCEFVEVTFCRRLPEFDQYAHLDRITDRIYIENGWGSGCPKCERICDEYTAVYDESGDWLKSCDECETTE
jgi:hypothetical protein